MAYVPDCSNPVVQQQIRDGLLPSNICDFPYEVLLQICERQPSLCQPTPQTAQPSIWEPIWGTVESAGERILTTGESIGTGALGTLDLANTLAKILPFLIVGGAALYVFSVVKK
jgi:hypothetical protein